MPGVGAVAFGCLALALAGAIASRSDGASPSAAAVRQDVLWHEATAVVPTRLVFPEDFQAGQARTLVVVLHGYGSSPEAFRRVADELAEAGFLVALPRPPYAFLADGRLAFDWTLHHVGDDELANRATMPLLREYLPSVVRDIRERHAVGRTYALGFSQGAVLALGTAVFNPDLFDGAVSFGLPDFRPGWIPPGALAAATEVGLLFLHGDADEQAPFEASEAARDHFADAGYEVTLQPFRGGHSVPDEQIEAAVGWMRERGGR